MPPLNPRPRRGWREPAESGLWKVHRAACASSRDHRPGRRCSCDGWQFKEPGSRQVITVHGSREEARRARARKATSAANSPAPRASDETLLSFAESWFKVKAPTWRPATKEINDRAYRFRIHPDLGHRRLDELTRERLEVWLSDLVRRDPAQRSVGQAVETLCSMLGTAVEWKRLPANPAQRLRMPKGPPRQRRAERVITPEQVDLLLAAASDLRTETLILAGLDGALRRGEIIGLRWPNVRLPERRFVLSEAIWQGATTERVVQTPKSGSGRRAAMSARLCDRLAAYYQEQVIEGGFPADGLVWPGRGGRAMAKDSPNQLLERVMVRAGLYELDGLDRNGEPKKRALVSLHGLRHTGASLALRESVPLIVVSRQLGHARVDVTAKVYSHLIDDSDLDAFGEAFGRSPVREPVRGSDR